jgi:hypothetical protein
MFQNAQIAKDHGESVRKSFQTSDRGYVRAAADEAGRQSEAIMLDQLNKWTQENVGLD